MKGVLISVDALSMLAAAGAAFYTMSRRSYLEGSPLAPSKDEINALQVALREVSDAVGGEQSATLQRVLREQPL